MFRDLGDVIILVSVGTRPSEVAIIGGENEMALPAHLGQ